MERIIVIDDEMFIEGSSERAFGALSEADLALHLVSSLRKMGFEVNFYQTVDDALEAIAKDNEKEIKLVFLDNEFHNDSSYQGLGGFKQIRFMREDLPIVVMSKHSVRKPVGFEDIFMRFFDLGADFYIPKKDFISRKRDFMNYINAIVREEDNEYIFRYKLGLDYNTDPIIDIDIVRKDQEHVLSVLKNFHRIKFPMSDYIEGCLMKFPEPLHWKNNPAIVKEMTSTEFAKAKHRLNDIVMRSSGGRIPNLLLTVGPIGWKLNVSKIEEM